jgi:hypothetical protein
MKTRAAIDLLASEIPGMLSDGPRFKAIGEIA